jgi:hypothetical protein
MNTTTELSVYASERNQSIVSYKGVYFFDFSKFILLTYKKTYQNCLTLNIDISFKNKDVIRLFVYNLLVCVIEFYLSSPSKYTAFVYCKQDDKELEYTKCINRSIKKIKTILPVNFILYDGDFSHFTKDLNNKKISAVVAADEIISHIFNLNNSTFNFSKLKKFLKDNHMFKLLQLINGDYNIKRQLFV